MKLAVTFALFFGFLFVSCTPLGPRQPSRVIANADGKVGTSRGSPAAASQLGSTTRPRVSVDPGDTVLYVVEVNLDLDSDLEQIIAVKNADNADSPVRVLIADSDSSKGRYYFVSWESPTLSTSPRVFSLTLFDLVGDHGIQIIVRGMNPQGLLTLDVFAKDTPSQDKSLAFHPVCSVAANDVRVEEVERDEQYTREQKNGESFPIITYFPDQESKNVLDTIRVTYDWKYGEGRYVAQAPIKVQGEQVDQKKLEDLYTSSGVEGFEKYIEGAWVSYAEGPSRERRPVELISFEPKAKRISRYMGDTEEIYLWNYSYRILASRMDALTRSEPVPTIVRTFKITATIINTLEINIEESGLGEVSTGVFEKLSDDVERKYFFHDNDSAAVPSLFLSGDYSDAKGRTISFQDANAIWKENGTERRGVYYVFSLADAAILTLRFPEETLTYLLASTEKKSGNILTKTILLTPVELTVSGYEEIVGSTLSMVSLQKVGS